MLVCLCVSEWQSKQIFPASLFKLEKSVSLLYLKYLSIKKDNCCFQFFPNIWKSVSFLILSKTLGKKIKLNFCSSKQVSFFMGCINSNKSVPLFQDGGFSCQNAQRSVALFKLRKLLKRFRTLCDHLLVHFFFYDTWTLSFVYWGIITTFTGQSHWKKISSKYLHLW